MFKTLTSVLKSSSCTGNPILTHASVFCKALFSDAPNSWKRGNSRMGNKSPDEEKSEWLQLNDKVYPPRGPNEEPRPAFVCHELLNVKYSPKKMWVAACFVRGMTVDEALKQLASAKKKGALIVTRAIQEAVEMAVREHNVEFRSNLWVAESFCVPGLIVKGIRRRGRGFISKIRYRYSNYYIRLEEGQPPEDYYCKNAQWTGPQMFADWMKQMRNRRVTNSL